MNLEPGKRREPPPPMYRSPMHGRTRPTPAERGTGGREREWLRYQIQGYGRKYWEPVAETDDRARALAEGVKRARVGSIAYRVWDRVDRKEIWRGFGHGASVEEWKTTRPPGMIGENPKDYKGLGKRGRWSYVVLATKGWFGPFQTKQRAMLTLARVRRKVLAGVQSPLYEGQGELVIGQVRRSPQGWEFTLPGTQHVTYHYDKARAAILRAIGRRPRPNDRRTAMSITTRPARLRVNPVLSRRMQALRPGTMRLGDAMRYGKALLEAGYVIRVWDGSGWEVVVHPNDSMATASGKGASGGRAYLAHGAGMVKTWPITLIAYRGQQSLGWMTPGKIRALLARPRVSANSGQDVPTFDVMHVSVDGAGYTKKGITLKRHAIALAQKHQSKSDRRGNPFGYHYIVYRTYPSGRTDAIYRTKSRPKASANWNGSRRQKIALMNSSAVANARAAHTAIVSAFMAGKSRRFGTSPEMPGNRYVTDGRALRVWGHVVAEKVPGGIRLSDAGYQTLLTKNVLNTVLDALGHSRISQMRHRWYIGSREWPGEAVIPTGALANRRRSAAARNGVHRRGPAVFCTAACKSGFISDRRSGLIYPAIHESDAQGKRTGKWWRHEEYSGTSGTCAYCGKKIVKKPRRILPHTNPRARRNNSKPTLTLSVSTSESDGKRVWSVLYQGQPLCAQTTEERARKVLADARRKMPRVPVTLWDGDAGKETPLSNPRRKKFVECVVARFRKWELLRLAKRHLEDNGVLAKAYRFKGGPWRLVVKEYNVAKAKTLLRGMQRRNPRARTARNCHTLLGKAAARRAMKFA